MKIFVTGGTGNIGQYVTLELLARGHHVTLLTRTPDRFPDFAQMENVTIIGGDMHQTELLEQGVQGCDAVIHIALGWGNDPVSMLQNDTRITAFLLDAAEKAGVQNFIYTSSTAATGPMGRVMDENVLRMPNDLYGATKAASEVYLLGFRQYYGPKGKVNMRRNIIRPGYTFSNPAFPGGYSQSDVRFKNIADAIVNNRDMQFPANDGTQFISSGQIAKLYADLVESDLNEEIFFALGNRFITWYEIALAAKDMMPEYTGTITAVGEKGEPEMYVVDKMKKVFGLSFDGWDDLTDHIRWNLRQAMARKG